MKINMPPQSLGTSNMIANYKHVRDHDQYFYDPNATATMLCNNGTAEGNEHDIDLITAAYLDFDRGGHKPHPYNHSGERNVGAEMGSVQAPVMEQDLTSDVTEQPTNPFANDVPVNAAEV